MLRSAYRLARGTGIALLLAAAPISSAYAMDSAGIEQRSTSLDPGEYVWNPAGAPEGPIEIVVSIPMQLAYVYRGGQLIGASTVSTGMPGHDTPTGTFTILQKRRTHFSNLYDNAPMPFMQRLTWDGIALHAGQIPGTPASHGCVRLPMAFARTLFGATGLGTRVHIVDASFASAEQALAIGRTMAPDEHAELASNG
ncbi:L,D-transpeptidase family protein [Sphingosinicella sp. YJ22]|uniref:L,D-transpeptidase family protein n=1 Tax=Sphingosinicella sp. YJ22 TaxID=1104780 RepID=UPI00140894E9|nr:L,D-transpeptidase family protein [Sphingosinicella sp. YJ22]